MKLIHLSDLHVGKRLNEFSLLDDQKYILDKILQIVTEETPDAVLLAGDIYDKSIPSAEAVRVFDEFLAKLARKTAVFLISGNHDSPERLAFGRELMAKSNVYLSSIYAGPEEPTVLRDGYGEVAIYLLPFVKPPVVRSAFPDAAIESYNDAVKTALSALTLDPGRRNVLVAHQFVIGAILSESETLSVGGLDYIDASVLEPFDYVALGHIHKAQTIKKETIRYSGTPLVYSFSESEDPKSVTVVTLKEKGNCSVSTIPLVPYRRLRKIRGSYMELTNQKTYQNQNTDDYLSVTLTDEEDVIDAMQKLRTIYPNIMELRYDNARTRTQNRIEGGEEKKDLSPFALFEEFYLLQNNAPLTEAQKVYLQEQMELLWEERNGEQ